MMDRRSGIKYLSIAFGLLFAVFLVLEFYIKSDVPDVVQVINPVKYNIAEPDDLKLATEQLNIETQFEIDFANNSYGNVRMRELHLRIASGLAEDELSKLIAGLTHDDLISILSDHGNMNKQWFQDRGMSDEILRELVTLLGRKEKSPTSLLVDGLLTFSTEPQNEATVVSDIFFNSERYIYGTFGSQWGTHNQVVSGEELVVRWTDLSNRSIVSLDVHKAQSESDITKLQIWMRPNSDWRPGEYRVELFRADHTALSPIAAGTYTIKESSDHEALIPFSTKVESGALQGS